MMRYYFVILVSFLLFSCGSGGSGRQSDKKSEKNMDNNYQVHLITVDPGHFHAALVQKTMYDQVSPTVHLYAPEGPDHLQHIDRINSYNNRADNPTNWNTIIYTGDDFFEKMLEEKAGNVVVLSGNNRKKAEYISRSVNAGLNVLADKPVIISPDDFPALEEAFRVAEEKGILLYDIMTERYEVTTILQKLLSQKEEIFGQLSAGTKEDPAIVKESVHHFSKIVSGTPLQRPAWFFDVEQQGEGMADVTTHLVDLIQWECFPGQLLYPSDVEIADAKRWPTMISKEEFTKVTGINDFPDFLQKDVKNGQLYVYSNGEIIYQIKGIWAKVSVTWNYEAPPGGGDTHYSVMHGSKCDLVIRQGMKENFVPALYVENIKGESLNSFRAKLETALASLPYNGLETTMVGENVIKIDIPQEYRVTHEEHFGEVTSVFLEYIKAGKLPEWEIKGMITKYYTTTTALRMARENN
ncbi:MAG TPA: putative oxidoreductase C-terminal domain-containing protein [Bacteroidales bacterium]|nr:putative oxidoreductase C-terminal domain-containing protein [Bacteroidales bacterium]